MMSQICLVGALCSLILLPGLLDATSLMKIIKNQVSEPAAVSIDHAQAHGFLSNSRPKRHIDPRWYRNQPDFQSYYRYYNSIGHVEGLYEIDRIRMLYQQMRHLELVHGPNASNYQNTLGLPPAKCDPSKDKKCKPPAPPPTTPPPPPPTTPPPPPPSTPPPPPPISQADVVYLCHPKDPLCKPHLVYLPTVEAEGEEEEEADEEPVPMAPEPLGKEKSPAPFLYDYRRELFDPYLYSQPAPDLE
ncbi:hypothetical protein MATL_G00045660 [Megalops atlanticus]|uniref:Actinodin3 n=1 Tax=Megalops atlanticus TaxID=7932 RepID=A0A9D3Q9J6_MEGAT|nr:hypothetical protein MATL_G00045660 [Megalops atlanticus]